MPVLPNTTARFDDLSSTESESSSNEEDPDSGEEDTRNNGKQKNDPELLRSIFPRPNSVTRRLWSKHGFRFHRLPKEQQQRAYKREHQIYLLEEANSALESIQEKIQELDNFRIECGIPDVQRASRLSNM